VERGWPRKVVLKHALLLLLYGYGEKEASHGLIMSDRENRK
jgi:hypothetical protein